MLKRTLQSGVAAVTNREKAVAAKVRCFSVSASRSWFDGVKAAGRDSHQSRVGVLHSDLDRLKNNYGSGELVREFISKELYDEEKGYFNAQECINTPVEPLKFNKMSGMGEYHAALKQLYYDGIEGWTTPVEIFQPWYGQAVVHWIMDIRSKAKEIKVIFNVDLQTYCPLLLLSTLLSQTTIWLLSRLVQKLDEHRDRCVQLLAPSWDLHHHLANLPPQTTPFIIGLELLDNLVHDKIATSAEGGVLQTHVYSRIPGDSNAAASSSLSSSAAREGSRTFFEKHLPLSDPVVARATSLLFDYEENAGVGISTAQQTSGGGGNGTGWVQWIEGNMAAAWEAAFGAPTEVFVPSGCVMMLSSISKAFPSHHLLLADFDFLPGKISDAVNSPVVAQKIADDLSRRGETRDMDTYLVDQGTADIFFPTDFGLLQHMYIETMGEAGLSVRSTNSERHPDFFSTYNVSTIMHFGGIPRILKEYLSGVQSYGHLKWRRSSGERLSEYASFYSFYIRFAKN
eukprot:jgi/Bigna1/71088/fgenesh1_pg.14_\